MTTMKTEDYSDQESKYLNPFAGSSVVVNKCIKERKGLDLSGKEIEDENEFFILYTDGTLIRKTTSQVPSSKYI